MLIGLAFFLIVPFVILAAFGISKPLLWLVVFLIMALILGLGFVLGLGLSAFFMDQSYFHEMEIRLMTTKFVDGITRQDPWKFLLMPYVFIADIIVQYFKISFAYKPNFILWFCEAWTWLLCFKLVQQSK